MASRRPHRRERYGIDPVDGGGPGTKLSAFCPQEARGCATSWNTVRSAATGNTEGRPQRAMPLWQREEIQALLWKQLDADPLICADEFLSGDDVRIETNQDVEAAITRLVSRT